MPSAVMGMCSPTCKLITLPDADRTHGTSEPGSLTEPLLTYEQVGQETSSLDMTKRSNLTALLGVLTF
jgi:hypothetical protein